MNDEQRNLVEAISRGNASRTTQLLGNFNCTDLHFETDNGTNILGEAAATANVAVMQVVLAAGNWTAAERDQALVYVNAFIFEQGLAEDQFHGVQDLLDNLRVLEHEVTDIVTDNAQLEQTVAELMAVLLSEDTVVSGMHFGSAAF